MLKMLGKLAWRAETVGYKLDFEFFSSVNKLVETFYKRTNFGTKQ